jgi:hypothetical protein
MRIRRELASLQQALPLQWGSSALCVVDEERPEFFSFMLVGPEGTPCVARQRLLLPGSRRRCRYQNGLFLFDGYLPPEFPNVRLDVAVAAADDVGTQVPPKISLVTTGGGRVRFNPNLYKVRCGKRRGAGRPD